MRSPSSLVRLIGFFLCLAVPVVTSAPCAAEDRESPPERLSVEELMRRARGSGDRVAIGWSGPTFAPVAPGGLVWSFLGPTAVTGEYWSGYANAAGRVSSIAVHPTNPLIAYIAAAGGGVWATGNGGASWIPLTDQLSSLSSGAVAIDPLTPSRLYYGTGEQHYSGDSFYGDGLFRSTNGGTSWTKIATRAVVGSYISRVVVDPLSPNMVFVASDLGVLRSFNYGQGLSNVLSGSPGSWCNDLVIDPTDDTVLYASLYGDGIYKSVDGGSSWTILGGGLPTAGYDRINLAIAPSNPQVLYASYVNSFGGLLGMYRTADGGATWTQLSATPDYLYEQGWYDNCLIVDPGDPDVCIAGGMYPYGAPYGTAGLILTQDGGAIWSEITSGIDGSQVHPDMHALAYGPDGKLWLGNDGGVWTTIDRGKHWVNHNSNLAITQFYKLGLHPLSQSRMIGGTQDNGTLLYFGGSLWPQQIEGDGGPCGYEWDSPTIFYSTYVRMTYLLRWNAGAFDADVTGPWLAAGDRASFANGPLVFDPNTPNTLLAGTYRVWRSFDSGASWTDISGDLTGGGFLRAIAVAWGSPNTMYTASTDGLVYFTTDGVTWNPRSDGLPAASLPDIAMNPANPLVAYTCAQQATGPRVFKTPDAGATWIDVSTTLPPNLAPYSLAVEFHDSPPRLYLGTDYGVYTSADDGATWTKEASLPNVAVYDLQLDGLGNLVASTHGRGVWRAAVGLPVAVSASGPARAVALHDVSPNPVRLPALLRYELPRPSAVKLDVFDVQGRRVASLERGARAAGLHEARWDGRDASGARTRGGVYFVRLEAGEVSQARRFVLLDAR